MGRRYGTALRIAQLTQPFPFCFCSSSLGAVRSLRPHGVQGRRDGRQVWENPPRRVRERHEAGGLGPVPEAVWNRQGCGGERRRLSEKEREGEPCDEQLNSSPHHFPYRRPLPCSFTDPPRGTPTSATTLASQVLLALSLPPSSSSTRSALPSATRKLASSQGTQTEWPSWLSPER